MMLDTQLRPGDRVYFGQRFRTGTLLYLNGSAKVQPDDSDEPEYYCYVGYHPTPEKIEERAGVIKAANLERDRDPPKPADEFTDAEKALWGIRDVTPDWERKRARS